MVRSGGCVYCSAINLCEHKSIRIGQFWRLLNFNVIFNYAILLPGGMQECQKYSRIRRDWLTLDLRK